MSAVGVDRSWVLESYRRYYNAPLAKHFELAGCSVEVAASDSTVIDEMGRRYLDVGTAHGVFGVGHCNLQVRAAVQAQLEGLSARVPLALDHQPGAALKARLGALLPGDLNRVLLAGSGSEAVEVALRTALLARPGRTRLIAMEQGYHGKTLGALGVMGLKHLRGPFEPLWPDVRRVPYGDAGRLEAAIGKGAAAVVVEPVLGGGAIQVPPAGYLESVREICDRTDTLLIVDEVQTGLGRTGRMFGIEHAGIVPDLIVLSKTLTGGHVPIAATVVRDKVAEEAERRLPGHLSYDSESAGWPVVAAAANATLAFISENSLPERARSMGGYLLDCMRSLAACFPDLVVTTPGIGLMTGICVRNRIVEHALWLQLRRRNVIVGLSLNSGAASPVLRVYPPLTVERHELDRFIEALYDSLATLQRQAPRTAYKLAAPAMKLQFWMPRRVLGALANRAASIPGEAGI